MPALAAYPDYSSNDYGGIGLMQVPTARFADDGTLSGGISIVKPYNQALLGIQLLPWLETQLRYIEVENRLYGPIEFSGDQTYKDRSVDFKIRLLEESDELPALALGIMDVGGTGLFSSEYLVASRRWWDLDVTFGLAWGRLGSRGGIRNPFAAMSSKFETRESNDIGDITLNRFFRGRDVGVFGGVQWQTPFDGWSLKLEYDGNDYQHEAMDNDQEVHFPVNAGLNWRLWKSADLSAGIERGDTLMLRFSAFTNLAKTAGPPKVLDPATTPVHANELAAKGTPLVAADAIDQGFYERLKLELDRQQIALIALDGDARRGLLTVWYAQQLTRDPQRAVGRIAQALAVLAPADYSAFTAVNMAGDFETSRVTVMRREVDAMLAFKGSPEELKATSFVESPRPEAYAQAAFSTPSDLPAFSWGMGPALRQHVGGPDDFYFGQLWWRVNGNLDLTQRWSFAGSLGANIYNNFDGLEVRDTSVLPHVRSDVVQYLQQGENNLVKLETNYIWSPARDWTTRISAGIFEEMYGGVAAEALYAPAYKSWAIGLNVNRVRKRDFDQRFDFQRYEVTTGHLTGYFQLPFFDLQGNVSVGRYLAGDIGGTLQLGRVFPSGVVVGAFATKTDVSAEDFGEGSFDKGLFIYLPFDLFFLRSTRRAVNLVFRPLTRDGGQKVRDGIPLYAVHENSDFDPDADWSQMLK